MNNEEETLIRILIAATEQGVLQWTYSSDGKEWPTEQYTAINGKTISASVVRAWIFGDGLDHYRPYYTCTAQGDNSTKKVYMRSGPCLFGDRGPIRLLFDTLKKQRDGLLRTERILKKKRDAEFCEEVVREIGTLLK